MFKVFISAVSLLFIGTLACAEVTVVGAYSNRVIADAHAQGYGIELWKEGNAYFGFFLSTTGMADDIPIGILDDLRYDPTDKSLSFKTKMTVGRSTMNGETWVPTRDIYRFEGTLLPDQISGHLIHADDLKPDTPATQDDIKLYRAKDEEAAMPVPASYDQWAELARKLLAMRGPKW
jgi:hypothetical protein